MGVTGYRHPHFFTRTNTQSKDIPMKSNFLFLVCAAVLTAAAVSCEEIVPETELSATLRVLDQALEHSQEYVNVRQLEISSLQNMLNSRGVNLRKEYEIYGELFNLCSSFNFDQAKDAATRQLEIAEQLHDPYLVNRSLLSLSMLNAKSGLFLEAARTMEKVDTTKLDNALRAEWYNVCQRFESDYAEYSRILPSSKVKILRQKYISMTDPQSSMNAQLKIQLLISEGEYHRAAGVNRCFIDKPDHNTHEYAIHAYWQARICKLLGQEEEALCWWAKSAIADVMGAVKDNASLCSLANELILTNDVDRAFRYIRISMDDALFFNAKLRQNQIASALPVIEKRYYMAQAEKRYSRNIAFFVLTLFAILLAVISVISAHYYRKAKKSAMEIEEKNKQILDYCKSIEDAERSLIEANHALSEANAAKEEYLGLFLSMCSGYIDKLKKFISREEKEAELRNFYKTFDTAFLELYPNFVSEFNALLREEERISLKDGELLSTEMRIFALIKLGITQSSHIASLLRYSVNTIYNYRAKIKNAALDDREQFEDKIKKIGSKC